jgi:cytochrome b6
MTTETRNKALRWLDERLPMSDVLRFFAKKTVPQHKHSFWYYFGGLTLFFFIVQVVTGILLALYYKPSPDAAYESIQKIVNEVPYGWLIRSLHSWSANLMVGALFIHMFSAFLMKAYRKPRELMWVSGVLLLFLVLGFCFTGYLLPWDTIAYFATLIGTEVPKTLPIIGDWGVSLLKGEDEIGAETLSRMHTIHITILPLMTLAVVSLHLLMSQVFGSSVPIGTEQQKPPIPFFPNFMYRDLIAWVIGFIALIALATIFPWGLGAKADPLASAPAGIRPEWYFLPLFQTLKITPSSVFGVNGELIVNALVGVGSLFWLSVPFIDRNASNGKKSLPFTVLGVILIVYIAATIILALRG